MMSFATTYVITPDRRELVSKLRRLKKTASDVWFATDLDREGEAISWHIAEVLDVKPENAKRVVFNAITKSAIREAFEHPRPINMSRVNALNSRRILDRIHQSARSRLVGGEKRQAKAGEEEHRGKYGGGARQEVGRSGRAENAA